MNLTKILLILLPVLVTIGISVYLLFFVKRNIIGYTPRKLLIYYGWPSAINGSNGDVSKALEHYEYYDDIVFGETLEETSHGDHENTKEIITKLNEKGKRVFGYITANDFTGGAPEVDFKILRWSKFDITGLLVDEFGLDFPNMSRSRQNQVLDTMREYNLTPIMNAWDPNDVFLEVEGVRANVKPGDIYLSESFMITEGQPQNPSLTNSKAVKLIELQKQFDFDIFAVTTDSPFTSWDQKEYDLAYNTAGILGYNSVGWGEHGFGGPTSIINTRKPSQKLSFKGVSSFNWPEISRETDKGKLSVNTDNRTFSFD